jgi:4-hydroxy-2-oxoheptanedioate aldolase
MNPKKTLRERLSSRRACLGLLQTHPNSVLAEMAGMCGYDFVLLDCEHGAFNEGNCLQTLQALAATGVPAMVRIVGDNPGAIGRYLDMGAEAIVVPNVSSAEQAKDLVRAMEYPPTGTRGFGASLHRATRYGMDLAAHLKAPREGISLLAIIESARGVANAEEIFTVDGLDGVIIGPSDLSTDLGYAREFSHPDFAQAVARIERAAATHNKMLGTAPYPGSPLGALVARGHRLLILNADMSLIREAMTLELTKAHSSLALDSSKELR